MSHDPILIRDFGLKFVVPFSKANQKMKEPQVYVDSWRSLNGRPFQRWIRNDIELQSTEMFPFSFDSWIYPRLEQVNSLDWLNYQQQKKMAFQQEGFHSVFFADSPSLVWTVTFHSNFQADLYLVALKGEMELTIEGMDSISMIYEKKYRIPLGKYHSIQNIGKTTSCWVYLFKYSKISFSRAIMMD